MMLYRLYFNFSGREPLSTGLLSILLCLCVFNVRPTDFPGSSFSLRLIIFRLSASYQLATYSQKTFKFKICLNIMYLRIALAGWHSHVREQDDWALETPVKPSLVLIGHNPNQPPSVAPPPVRRRLPHGSLWVRTGCSYFVGRSHNFVDISWVVSGRFGLLLQKRRNGNDTARVIQNSAHLFEENKGGEPNVS